MTYQHPTKPCKYEGCDQIIQITEFTRCREYCPPCAKKREVERKKKYQESLKRPKPVAVTA